ncbi:MAG: DNA repair protein, partial [Flavobacteriaceae bacterium]|nr:DNA repair protein [Flavobacteriaceae bacterium]
LFVIAIKTAASSIIMAHNHPSGNLNPSECDKRLFEKIVKASKLLDINILDNLIISNHGYYSFADEGLI